MSMFHCCTCPEPDDYDAEADDPLPKFRGRCGCPTVDIECVSEEKEAELCGFPEYDGYESTPPNKYLIKSQSGSYKWILPGYGLYNRDWIGEYHYDEDCALITDVPAGSEAAGYKSIGSNYSCSDETTSGTAAQFEFTPISSTEQTLMYRVKVGSYWLNHTDSPSYVLCTNNGVEELDAPDNEDDALDRATAVYGEYCSSIYEQRTTSYGFTHRTVEYTAIATNLVIGVEYHGCVRLQRRAAYSGTEPDGADLDWHDVEPDTIAAFTATSDTEVVAEDVELPIEQGWEYRINGAYIYPTSSDCECPSTYVAPEE